MPFTVDAAAPRMSEDYELLSRVEVASILEGAQLICESVEDDDVERWLLTRGGQFVRNTGEDANRFYVVPPEEAWDYLNDWCDDDVLAEVRATGAFGEAAPAPMP